MVSSGILRRVALVRADVSEDLSASFIRLTRIGELGTTLAVTNNRRTLRGISSQRASVASYS
jgi:DNA-binding TFAR19-related protein (PDSD5 family)